MIEKIVKRIKSKIVVEDKDKKKEINIKDSFIRSRVIYNTDYTYNIILISYTRDYLPDAIEFLDACNYSGISTKSIHTSYEVENPESNENLSFDRFYLLFSFFPYKILKIYKFIETLSNRILSQITNDIYNNFSSKYFTELIEDGILDKNSFTNHKNYNKDIQSNEYQYTNIQELKQNLPKEFSYYDIIKFIVVSYKDDTSSVRKIKTLDQIIEGLSVKDNLFFVVLNIFKIIYGRDNIEIEDMKELITPRYKLPDRDDEDFGLTGIEVDEIFSQQYDRFNAIMDENTIYKDIDEITILGDDESK